MPDFFHQLDELRLFEPDACLHFQLVSCICHQLAFKGDAIYGLNKLLWLTLYLFGLDIRDNRHRLPTQFTRQRST